jgi:hypothetical protein
MKNLFDPSHNYRYTEDAACCEDDARAALKVVFRTWIEKGYSAREISHILISSAVWLEGEALLNLRFGRPPFDKE